MGLVVPACQRQGGGVRIVKCIKFEIEKKNTYAGKTNKKLYNAGSEWQDDIENMADYYSTFFREYDPVIGRFNGVDPMAEVTDEITTYAYANNNPVMMNDPMGDFPSATGYQPPSMRELLERVMSSHGWGGGWEDNSNGGGGGGGIGSYNYFKAHLDYLGSPEWKKDLNAKEERKFFSSVLSNGINQAGGSYWFANGQGQYSETPNIFIYGNISDAQWNTNRVEFNGDLWHEGYEIKGGKQSGGYGGINFANINIQKAGYGTTGLGILMVLAGGKFVPKVGALGSVNKTSIISEALRNLKWNFSKPVGTFITDNAGNMVFRTTTSVGGVIARWVPVLGWVLLGYDFTKEVALPMAEGMSRYQESNRKSGNWIANLPH